MLEIIISTLLFLLLTLLFCRMTIKMFKWVTEPTQKTKPESQLTRAIISIVLILSAGIALCNLWAWASRIAITASRQANAQLTAGVKAVITFWSYVDYGYVAIVYITLFWGLIEFARCGGISAVTKLYATNNFGAKVGKGIVNALAVIAAIFALTLAFELPDGSAGLILITLAFIAILGYLTKWWFDNGRDRFGASISYAICCLSTTIISNEYGWNYAKSIGGITGMTFCLLFNGLLFFFFVGLCDPDVKLWDRKGFKFIILPWMLCLMLVSGISFWLQASGKMTWPEKRVARALTIANQEVELLERRLTAKGTDDDLTELQEAVKRGDLKGAKEKRDGLAKKNQEQREIARAEQVKPQAVEEIEITVKSFLVKFNNGKWKREHRFAYAGEEWKLDVLVAAGDSLEIHIPKGSVSLNYANGSKTTYTPDHEYYIEEIKGGGNPRFTANSPGAEIYIAKR